MVHHHIHHLPAFLWHITMLGCTARIILRWISSFLRSIFQPPLAQSRNQRGKPPLAQSGFRIVDNYPLTQES